MRPRPRVLTPTGWAVIAAVLGLALGLCLFSGCDARAQAPPLPTTVDVPRETKRPDAIPPQAERYARTLVRAWQYYFDLAEPASIGFAQVHQESRWKETARSPVGASGLGQFMPATAEWVNGLLPAEVRDSCSSSAGCPEDPGWALAALARFDYLLHRGAAWATASSSDRWAAALVGYNGGAGWVTRERAEAGRRGLATDRWWGTVETVCLRSAGACRESRAYPHVILERWRPLYRGWLGE